jgi:hypothetical protein
MSDDQKPREAKRAGRVVRNWSSSRGPLALDRRGADGALCVHVPRRGRTYDFSWLALLFGDRLAKRYAAEWQHACEGVNDETAKDRFRSLSRWFGFVAEVGQAQPASAVGQLYRELSQSPDRMPDSEVFLDATNAFTAACHDLNDNSVVESTNRRTRSGILENLSATFACFAKRGVVPRDHALRSIPRSKAFSEAGPSLADLGRLGRLDWSDDLTATLEVLSAAGASEQLQLDQAALRRLSMQERFELYCRVNRARLQALRHCAVNDLLAARDAYRAGRRVCERDDLPDCARIEDALNASFQGGWSPRAMLQDIEQEYFVSSDSDWVARLRLLLVRYMSLRYNGVVRVRELPLRLGRALGAVGSDTVIRMLEGTGAALIAAFAIVLIDSTMNKEPVRRLHAEPVTSGKVRRRVRLSTYHAVKMRAGGQIVVAELIEGQEEYVTSVARNGEISTLETIEIWKELALPMRARVKERTLSSPDDMRIEDPKQHLWILPEGEGNGGRIKVLLSRNLDWHWRAFLKRHEGDALIGGLPITMKMIRATSSQLHFERGHFDQVAVKIANQHRGYASGADYFNSKAMARQLQALMRDFLELYEASAASDIAEVASLLGISPEEMEKRKKLAIHTGLGFLCTLAASRAGSGSEGVRCVEFENCPGCEMRRFVPNDEAFEALFLTRTALEKERERFERENPERWAAVWLPWLAICLAVTDRLVKGPHRLRYQRAAERASARLQHGTAVLPCLF